MPILKRTSSSVQASRKSVSRSPSGARGSRAAQILRQPAEDWTPAQVQHLQQQVGNRAVTQRLTTGKAPAVQRVIRVKTGEQYNAAGDLPLPLQASPTLTGLANAAETALALNTADLATRANGQAAPILTPHRHLIGEQHDASRFDEAVTTWGWGAAKMEEGFQTSQTVQDPYTQSWLHPGTFQSKAKVGVLPLEDVHARMLQDLSMYRYRLEQLRGAADAVRLRVGLNMLQADEKSGYNDIRAAAEDQKGQVLVRMQGYETACADILQQDAQNDNNAQTLLRVMATYMRDRWEPWKTQMKLVSSSPWNLIMRDSGDMGVVNNLQARMDAAQELREKIDNFAAMCIAVMKAENNNDEDISEAADTSWNGVTGGGHPLNSLSPIREAFMSQKINAGPRPLLVRMGAAHVANLNGHVNNAQYHNSYADFLTAVRGP